MLLLDVLDKIFGMFPVALIGVERKYFIFLCAIGYRLFFALAKGLHPGQPVIGLLVQILEVRFISTSHSDFLSCIYFYINLYFYKTT